MLRTAFFSLVLVTSSAWSLTIFEPHQVCKGKKDALSELAKNEIGINDQGDIALVWKEGQLLKLVQKQADAPVFSSETILGYLPNFNDLEWCSVDSKGNVQIFWENDDEELVAVRKSAGQPFSQLENLGKFSSAEQKSSGELLMVDTQNLDYFTQNVCITQRNLETPECITQHFGPIQSDISPIYLKDQEGKQFLFWGVRKENGLELLFSKKIGEGEWAEPESVPVIWPGFNTPEAFADSRGNIHVLEEKSLFSLSRIDGVWSKIERLVSCEEDIAEYIGTFPGGAEQQIDLDGNIMTVWTRYNGEDSPVLYAAYKPVGKPWENPIALVSSAQGIVDEGLALEVDEAGRFVVLWNEQSDWCEVSVRGRVFEPASKMWSSPFQLNPAGDLSVWSSFELRPNGRGAVSYVTLEDSFEVTLSVVEFSLD